MDKVHLLGGPFDGYDSFQTEPTAPSIWVTNFEKRIVYTLHPDKVKEEGLTDLHQYDQDEANKKRYLYSDLLSPIDTGELIAAV